MKKRILALTLVLIMAAASLPLAQAAAFPFTDVPSYHKDRTAIEFCFNNEFIKGSTQTTFNPDSTLTREQFAVIWGRTFHLRRHGFGDVTKVPNEFENAILVMQALGHVNGLSEKEFGRTASISREQAIAITHRAYLPGVDGKDAYKNYADSALISDWARESVSACKAEGLLSGVFTGSELRPGQPITRGEICHLIFNIMRKEYMIEVGETGSAEITVNKTATDGKVLAYPGETVSITVTPGVNEIIVPGSLKFNNTPITGSGPDHSFVMPFEDVKITAQTAKKLTGITIKTPSENLAYIVGQTLDLSDMVIQASYEGVAEPVVITNYTTSPANGTTLQTPGTVAVIVSYTENGITQTTVVTITVTQS